MRAHYYTLDVFTDRRFGGNPLAVFPDAASIPIDAMPKIAKELNLSETVFVLPPDSPKHTRRLRIFTPAAELPFAGHPTVGTAFLLAAIGDVTSGGDELRIVFEEGVGPVPVKIRFDDAGRPVYTELSAARMPEIRRDVPSNDDLARILSIQPDEIDPSIPAAAVSCGVPFLVVALNSPAALAKSRVDSAAWQRRLEGSWAEDLYLVTQMGGDVDYRVRMYAPSMGIAEDPATGAAATVFAGYLALLDGRENGTLQWKIEQGIEMGRPSRLDLAADLAGGEVTGIRVGGSSVVMGEGWLEIGEDHND